MQNKNSNSVALWFIPLVAVVLAVFFVFIFLVGKTLYKGIAKPPKQAVPVSQPVAPAAPVVPFVEMIDEEEGE